MPLPSRLRNFVLEKEIPRNGGETRRMGFDVYGLVNIFNEHRDRDRTSRLARYSDFKF